MGCIVFINDQSSDFQKKKDKNRIQWAIVILESQGAYKKGKNRCVSYFTSQEGAKMWLEKNRYMYIFQSDVVLNGENKPPI